MTRIQRMFLIREISEIRVRLLIRSIRVIRALTPCFWPEINKFCVLCEIFRQKVCEIRKNILPLHPQIRNEAHFSASVAQLVRAPDC